MLVIEVELLHDAVRAAPSTDEAVTGLAHVGEWPLSPARLFSALVAADGTGERCRVTDGDELLVLEAASPPTIIADATEAVLHNILRERYVVLDTREKGMVQGYPARKATLHRPGVRVHPKRPRLTYVYNDLTLDDRHLEALRRRAARVGYVGCADSPARVTVSSEPSQLSDGDRYEPGVGAVSLPVPYAGFLDALDALHAARQRGEARRSWLATTTVDYGVPTDARLTESGELLVLALDRPLAGHRALALTETLRSAIMSVAGDDAPAVLHGHGLSGEGHLQARYLALPFAGHEHADGLIRGVAIWLPPTIADADRDAARRAVLVVDELRSSAFGRRVLRPIEPTDRRVLRALQVQRWSAHPHGARRWHTVTPVVHERFGSVDRAEVARWFEHAGHPPPVRFRRMERPFASGGAELRPSQLRRRYGRHPFAHYEVEFDEPVVGPLLVGRGRQFGLGLFVPAPQRSEPVAP